VPNRYHLEPRQEGPWHSRPLNVLIAVLLAGFLLLNLLWLPDEEGPVYNSCTPGVITTSNVTKCPCTTDCGTQD
jgi:hypothetical protein